MTKEEIIDNIARLNSQTWRDREEVRTEIGKLIVELEKALERPTHGTCKDCKWWESDNDKIIGYCNACKHGLVNGRWNIGIYRKTMSSFYCGDYEKRGNESGL